MATGAPCEKETSLNLISRSPGPAEKSPITVPSALRARAKPGVPTLLAETGLAAKIGVSIPFDGAAKAGEAKVKIASAPLRSTGRSAVIGRATEKTVRLPPSSRAFSSSTEQATKSDATFMSISKRRGVAKGIIKFCASRLRAACSRQRASVDAAAARPKLARILQDRRRDRRRQDGNQRGLCDLPDERYSQPAGEGLSADNRR